MAIVERNYSAIYPFLRKLPCETAVLIEKGHGVSVTSGGYARPINTSDTVFGGFANATVDNTEAKLTGTHTTTENSATLLDSANPWTAGEFVGMNVYNTTKGEQGPITANIIGSITATLSGAADWDIGDAYEIRRIVELIPEGVIEATIVGVGDTHVDTKVYMSASNAFTFTVGSNILIGWTLETRGTNTSYVHFSASSLRTP